MESVLYGPILYMFRGDVMSTIRPYASTGTCFKNYAQGCNNRVSAPPVSAVRTTENVYTGVHADNQVLPTFAGSEMFGIASQFAM